MGWKCHVVEYNKYRYGMILGKAIFNALGLDLKFSKRGIIGADRTFQGCLEPMVDGSIYYLTSLTDKTINPE